MGKRAFFILLLISLSLPAGAEKVIITEISPSRDRGYDYLDIYTTGNVKGRGLLLEDQLIIEFPGAEISEEVRLPMIRSNRIKAIRLDRKAAQIIIDLKKDIDYEVVNVFGRNKSVVEIGDYIDYTAQLFSAWEQTSLKGKAEKLNPFRFEPVTESPDQSLRGKVIILDPGHGGNDPGAISKSGIPEKLLTLRTAREAARMLTAAGATVILTRNEDRRSSLKDIVAFANSSKADIFISLHYNYINKEDISGTETYYYNRISRKLARSLHKWLVQGLERKDRGLRRMRFYVVRHTDIPSVLVEPVYLSNPDEEKLAVSPVFQSELARCVMRGVKEYFRNQLSD